MEIKAVTPILRILDEAEARAYYVGFLGFRVDWEHRFQDGYPLYMQVTRGGCVLHLSGHHGDACPGAAIRVETVDLEGFQRELAAREHEHPLPGIKSMPWRQRELHLNDPFGNRLVFFEHQPSS